MPRRTQAFAQATRSALLDAAERVFERQGVARASLEAIAREAGVTRGAVYGHFRNKIDLFNAVTDRVPSPLVVCLDSVDAQAGADDDAMGGLLRAVRWALQQIALDAQVRRVLLIVTRTAEPIDGLGVMRDRMVQDRLDNAARIAAILERSAAQQGRVLAVPASTLGRAIYGLLAGLVTDWLSDPRFDLQAVSLDSLLAMLAGAGLKVPAADQG